jgi:hypothetical protein
MEKFTAHIRLATTAYPKFVVIVRELKFDTIRQSECYVTTIVREYSYRRSAEKFAEQYGWKPEQP